MKISSCETFCEIVGQTPVRELFYNKVAGPHYAAKLKITHTNFVFWGIFSNFSEQLFGKIFGNIFRFSLSYLK